MRCPHCGKKLKDSDVLSRISLKKVMKFAGSIGGKKGRGTKKARSSELAKKAARARWDKAGKKADS